MGEERVEVTAGEAVVWPPCVRHGAWTEGALMRAIVVEIPKPPLAIRPPSVYWGDWLVEPGAEPAGEIK